jgi:hypothetical protein
MNDGRIQKQIWLDNNFNPTGTEIIYAYDSDTGRLIKNSTYLNGRLTSAVFLVYNSSGELQFTIREHYRQILDPANGDVIYDLCDMKTDGFGWTFIIEDFNYTVEMGGGGLYPVFRDVRTSYYDPAGNEISQEQYDRHEYAR